MDSDTSTQTPDTTTAPPQNKPSFWEKVLKFFARLPSDESVIKHYQLVTPESTLERIFSRDVVIDNKEGSYLYAEDLKDHDAIQRRYDMLMESVKAQAAEMGVENLRVYISKKDIFGSGSKTSAEGNNYVNFGEQEFLFALTSDKAAEEFKGTIGHELTHLARKDTSLDNMVHEKALDKASTLAQGKLKEEIADVVGAGPLGSHDPQSAADSYKRRIKEAIVWYNKVNKTDIPLEGASPDQVEKAVDASYVKSSESDHPYTPDRVAYLEREAALMKQYEATHKVFTHEDRVAESNWLLDQVLGKGEGKTRTQDVPAQVPAAPASDAAAKPEPTSPTSETPKGDAPPPPENKPLTPEQDGQIHEVRRTLGNTNGRDVQTHGMSATSGIVSKGEQVAQR